MNSNEKNRPSHPRPKKVRRDPNSAPLASGPPKDRPGDRPMEAPPERGCGRWDDPATLTDMSTGVTITIDHERGYPFDTIKSIREVIETFFTHSDRIEIEDIRFNDTDEQ